MKQDPYDIVVDYIITNQEKFYRLAYTYVRNEHDALDIVQNAICKALENYESIREISYIKTWFYRVLIHESINYIKKNKKEMISDTPFGEEIVYMETGYREKEGLFEELDHLPPETQTVIKLRYYEELSLKEIAEVTNVNINTVKARLYRGLRALKEEIAL